MNLSDFKDFAEGISALVSSAAILTGGAWAYWKFVLHREKEPRAQFDLDVSFVGLQDGKWLIEVSGCLANKGNVRHLVENATLNIRYLTSGDSVSESSTPRLYRQLYFPHEIGRRKIWWDSYIDPGLEFRNSYLTWVPDNAQFILVLCSFDYDKGKWPAQRVLKVPHPASVASGEATAESMLDRALSEPIAAASTLKRVSLSS